MPGVSQYEHEELQAKLRAFRRLARGRLDQLNEQNSRLRMALLLGVSYAKLGDHDENSCDCNRCHFLRRAGEALR